MKHIPSWLDTKEYPFASHTLQIDGHDLHYIDEGAGKVLLFVHGTPSWSFDFRHQIKTLSQTHRCIALDHIGFGLSDKPAQYDYSLQNHAKNLACLIQHLDLQDITLIVHDFGGIIGFDYALAYPHHIHQIVVLNSWLWSAENDTSYQKLKPILRSPLLPILYRWFNFSPAYLLPQSFGNKKKLTSHLKRHYTRPFSKASERYGTLAFARSLLKDQTYFESLWAQVGKLRDKPALFIWGMQDTFITPVYLEKFTTAFPTHTVVRLAQCGHFPQEEEAEAVLEAIKAFV